MVSRNDQKHFEGMELAVCLINTLQIYHNESNTGLHFVGIQLVCYLYPILHNIWNLLNRFQRYLNAWPFSIICSFSV